MGAGGRPVVIVTANFTHTSLYATHTSLYTTHTSLYATHTSLHATHTSLHPTSPHLPTHTRPLRDLVSAARPGCLPLDGHVHGMPMCSRILAQLASTVEELAGKEAVRKLIVVVHVHEGQQFHTFQR